MYAHRRLVRLDRIMIPPQILFHLSYRWERLLLKHNDWHSIGFLDCGPGRRSRLSLINEIFHLATLLFSPYPIPLSYQVPRQADCVTLLTNHHIFSTRAVLRWAFEFRINLLLTFNCTSRGCQIRLSSLRLLGSVPTRNVPERRDWLAIPMRTSRLGLSTHFIAQFIHNCLPIKFFPLKDLLSPPPGSHSSVGNISRKGDFRLWSSWKFRGVRSAV